MTLLATHTQETFLQSSALEIRLELRLQDSIFRPFTQADASTTRQYGGAGLGLTICRRLISMLGGKIWLDSEPGVGTQFHFTGRFGVAQQTKDEIQSNSPVTELNGVAVVALLEAPPKVTAPLQILLAEDNAVNQLVMTRMLHKRGHHVTVVSDGRSAVVAVSHETFDIVFMDVQMPLLDGFQATQEIRRNETEVARRTPVVALTAHAMQGDKERCLEAGMDGYLTKPIDRAELDRVLGFYGATPIESGTRTQGTDVQAPAIAPHIGH